MVWLVLLASVALIVGAWFLIASRAIKVWVYTDFAFRRNHPDWPGLIESRFREVNRIYQRNGTGIRWKVVDSSQVDPTRNVPDIDGRRATMALHLDRPTDVFVILTGVQQGERTGSVSPFTRVAIVVDYANRSESLNARSLAHELANLFGAPRDPAWFQTLMDDKPGTDRFSAPTLAIIRRMRGYPFARGIDAIADGSWEKRALAAASEDGSPMARANALGHAHTVLGTALIGERKMGPALAHFRAAAAADPRNKGTHLNLAAAYARDGQYDKALVEAREGVRLAPDDPLAHRALGAILGRAHQPEAAVEELRTAIRLQPDNAQNQVLLGFEYASMFGHLDDAVTALEQAARADPDSHLARTGLEKAEALKQQLESALDAERAAVQDHPDDPDAHYRLAKLEARAGDIDHAILDMQKAAELRPDSAATHTELAEFYLVRGDTDTAWAEIGKVRALGTEPPASLLARLPAQK